MIAKAKHARPLKTTCPTNDSRLVTPTSREPLYAVVLSKGNRHVTFEVCGLDDAEIIAADFNEEPELNGRYVGYVAGVWPAIVQIQMAT